MPLASFLAKLVAHKSVVRSLAAINVWVYRLSGGHLMNAIDGRPVCLVTLTRRKSRRQATIPLMYTPHGERVLLVASLGGAPQHPSWYHNLKANPRIILQLGRERRAMLAREAEPSERADLWPVVVSSFPSYADYQRKTQRQLPIMVCETDRPDA
jgi:deazaflavin-dependent oxidoreductase (nitroreductase family)